MTCEPLKEEKIALGKRQFFHEEKRIILLDDVRSAVEGLRGALCYHLLELNDLDDEKISSLVDHWFSGVLRK